MRTLLTSLMLSSAVAGLLVACGASPGDDASQEDDLRKKDGGAAHFSACEQQHVGANADGDSLIVCDKPFADAPHVRLPADDTSGDTVTLYVAYQLSTGEFFTRDGKSLYLTDGKGKALGFQDHGESLPKSMRMPSNRNMYTLYRVTGTISQVAPPFGKDKVPAIHVATGEPVAMIPGDVIDGTMLGTWEGMTNLRTADGKFSEDETPIRVSFTNKVAGTNLKVWESGTSLPDGKVFKLTGVIENWDKSVKGSDGKCYPALTGLGDKNPFHGAKNGKVDTYRLGGMHFAGDQVLVFTVPGGTTNWSMTAMGGLGPFSPVDWISKKGWSELSLTPHGMPMGNAIQLHIASGGGGGC